MVKSSVGARSLVRSEWIFILLAVILPGVAIVVTPSGATSFAVVLFPLGVTMYAAARLSTMVRAEYAEPLQLTFWLFVYGFLGIAAIAQLRTGSFPWVNATSDRIDLPVAYASIAAGITAYDLARVSFRRVPGVVADWLSRQVAPNRLVLVTVASIAMTTFILMLLGGRDVIFHTRLEGTFQLSGLANSPFNPAPVVSLMMRVPISISFIAWLAVVRSEKLPRPKYHLAALIALGLVTALVNNPISTPRFWVGAVAVASLFVLVAPLGSRRIAAYILSFVAALLVLFPLASTYRNTLEVSLLERIATSDAYTDSVIGGDFDAFGQIAGAAGYVDAQGHTLGRQTAGVLFFWVPRSIWHSKPDASGAIVADHLGNAFKNVSMPPWGWLYMDGGLILVVAGMFLYGRLSAVLDSIYARQVKFASPTLASLLVPILAGYQFYLLRGDPIPAVAYLVPGVITVALLRGRFVVPRTGATPFPRETTLRVVTST